ncbi:hypothetical protein GCM10011488_01910 [Steroidobacter agaridevorans]|nr:hypothetical protein GCM10011488_01910 [Steroidobacter agaridevorans]
MRASRSHLRCSSHWRSPAAITIGVIARPRTPDIDRQCRHRHPFDGGDGCGRGGRGSAIANGTLELSYQYVNDAKATKTGTVAIPFAATTANNVIATAACEMV